MINFDHIKIVYGDFVVVPDFDLRIEDGEFFTFLGPSGSGKSTALRALAGFLSPAAGRIEIDNNDVTFAHSSKRGLGMVFQNYALFPSMNVKDNIGFGLQIAKMSAVEIDRRVSDAAWKVDLAEEQLEKQISELSGGQQQRVAIARALVMEPSILLLDEPLSNLDARLRKQLREQLKKLQSDVGITMVYVTHDQEEALSLSDRIAVLNKGVIEQVGTPRDLYEESETEFVCTFLGEVNKLSAAQVQRLNEQDAGLNPHLSHYIRLERIDFARDLYSLPWGPVLSATVRTRSYFGDRSTYGLISHGSLIKVTESKSDVLYEEGDEIYLSIDPKWVRSYDDAGRRIR